MANSSEFGAKKLFEYGAHGHVRSLLKMEAAVVSLICIWLYHESGGTLGYFLLLILVPDLGLLGYLRSASVGAFFYNLTHNYALALLLCGVGKVVDSETALQVGLIWTAHVGIDRMLGFGLKYTSAFNDTHLGQLKMGQRPVK
jgi:hypothetical protein